MAPKIYMPALQQEDGCVPCVPVAIRANVECSIFGMHLEPIVVAPITYTCHRYIMPDELRNLCFDLIFSKSPSSTSPLSIFFRLLDMCVYACIQASVQACTRTVPLTVGEALLVKIHLEF